MIKRTLYLVRIATMTVWVLTGCKQQATQSVDGTTGSGLRSEHERLDQKLVLGMQQNADSVLSVIDSLQAHNILPQPIANFERGTCYAMMEKRRIGEYYFKKALEGNLLFVEWPEAYYRASTNLAILLSGKNDEQGALEVATTALNLLRQRTGDENSRWESALLFNIGSSQMRLGYHEEGLALLQKSFDGIRQLAQKENNSDVLRTWATLSVNIATVISNIKPEQLEPWLAKADEALTITSQSPEIPKALIDLLRSKVAMLKALYDIKHHRPQEAWQAYSQYMATDYAKMPQSYIEQLTFLEKSGQWEKASQLLPDIWQLHEVMGTKPDIDYMSDLAEGFIVNRKSGHNDAALEVGDRMALMVDSVKKYMLEDAAAELAVIYDSEEQKNEIARQQWRLRWLQTAAVAAFLALLIVSLTILIVIRQKAEKQLRVTNNLLQQRNSELEIANARAEESAKMKTNFIQQMSHEIRTPLNILSGFAQIITTPGLELDEKGKQNIRTKITRNTDRITQLVDKVIELADVSSKSVIERNDQIPASLIAAQAVETSGINNARHLTFDLQILPEARNATLQTNLKAAARALALLLDNAQKFTHTPEDSQHDKIKNKERAMLKVALNGKKVFFTVEDTGIGVPSGEAEHIFDEFVQLNEYYDGTGIGLTVARSIARRLGGDIRLDTDYTGGARFVMTLG